MKTYVHKNVTEIALHLQNMSAMFRRQNDQRAKKASRKRRLDQ